MAILPLALRAKESPAPGKPTVLLVHGAFAESSSWDVVTAKLLAKGYPVVAVAIPLRGVKTDASYLRQLACLDRRPGRVGRALVWRQRHQQHPHGGKTNVKALVFVSGRRSGRRRQRVGRSRPSSRAARSGPTLAPPVVLADGSKDLYIQQDK